MGHHSWKQKMNQLLDFALPCSASQRWVGQHIHPLPFPADQFLIFLDGFLEIVDCLAIHSNISQGQVFTCIKGCERQNGDFPSSEEPKKAKWSCCPQHNYVSIWLLCSFASTELLVLLVIALWSLSVSLCVFFGYQIALAGDMALRKTLWAWGGLKWSAYV